MKDETPNFGTSVEISAETIPGLVLLIEKERIDPAMTFKLESEQGIISEKGDSAFWVKLQDSAGKMVEGKFFVSGAGQEKLLVFEPGMPGDSNKWMEAKFVPELIRQGYSIFCIRHSGTKVNAENSSNYLNCPERITKEEDDAAAVIGKTTGKTEYTIEDIDDEPRIAIEALQRNFKQIFLVGHSSGSEGIAFSLPKLPKEITDKVRSFVSLAGYIGRYDEENDLFDKKGIFNSEKMKAYYEYCNRFIAMGDPAKNVELKKDVLKSIHRLSLPENINFVFVNTPKDEYVTVESSEEFRGSASGGRGLRIIDETQSEPEFHDLKNLRPRTLSRLLEIYHPKSKHLVTVKKEK